MCWVAEDIAKYFLFVTNLILFLLSSAILGISIWILVDKPSFLAVLGQANIDFPVYSTAAVILLVASVLVILVTFFGCCGAQQDSRCMLATYFLLILLLLIGLAVGAFMAFSGNMEKLKEPFIEALKQYDDQSSITTDKALVEAWDNFQQDFQCCGVDTYKDWQDYNPNFNLFRATQKLPLSSSKTQLSNVGGSGVYDPMKPNVDRSLYRYMGRRVPKSCCDPNMNQQKCSESVSSADGLRAGGCFTKVLDEINSHSGIIGGVAIGVVIVMVLNALISLYMCTCGSLAQRRTYRRAATRD